MRAKRALYCAENRKNISVLKLQKCAVLYITLVKPAETGRCVYITRARPIYNDYRCVCLLYICVCVPIACFWITGNHQGANYCSRCFPIFGEPDTHAKGRVESRYMERKRERERADTRITSPILASHPRNVYVGDFFRT